MDWNAMTREDRIHDMLIGNAWFDPERQSWEPLPDWKRKELEAELDAIEAAAKAS